MTYDLSQYDDAWDEAETQTYGEVAPGNYSAWIERATIEFPEWSSHEQLSLQLRIIGGEYANQCVFVRQSFDPEYIHFVKSAVAAMQLDPPVKSAGEITSRLEDMLDRVMVVKVVHKPSKNDPEKMFINTYIQSFVGMKDELMQESSEAQLDKLGF